MPEKIRLATVSLTGCFGCHMSLLDMDERLLDLLDRIEFVRSPLTDQKELVGPVEIGLVEGGVSSDEHVRVLRELRDHCRVLVSIGQCAISGGVPALRNGIPIQECLAEAFPPESSEPGAGFPSDRELPVLLDRVYACHEVVPIDHFIPGCPPSAETLWSALTALLEGRAPTLEGPLLRYD